MLARRLAFWGTVAVVAVLAPVGLNLAADKLPVPGLRRFRDYVTNTPRGAQ